MMRTEEKTILCVDDDADDREILLWSIQRAAPEINVAFAENGLQAIELLNDIKETKLLPCLIVLDLNMPYLNGRETMEYLKADTRLSNIPVVVFSSEKNPDDKALFDKAGVPYFMKPYDYSVMESIISQMTSLCD